MISSKEGFSALELMVVLGVVGILTILGVTDFLFQIPHNNLNGASRQIISDLRLIRQQAITEGAPKSIRFDPRAQSYCFYQKGACVETRALPSYVRFGVKQGVPPLPGGTTCPAADGVSFNNNTATFEPNGTLANFGTICLTNDPARSEAAHITVIITGRIKINRWNGSAWE